MELRLAIVIVLLAAFMLLMRAGKRRQESDAAAWRQERARALFEHSREFVSQIEASGRLPRLEAPRLNLPSGEFAILRQEGSVLRNFKLIQVPVGRKAGGSFAGINFYPRAWQLERANEMTRSAQGELYLTNLRLLFVSPKRHISIRWTNLVALETILVGVRIQTEDSESPIEFSVENAALWGVMIKWMCLGQINSPELLPGTRIMLKRDVHAKEIDSMIAVTVTSDDPPSVGS